MTQTGPSDADLPRTPDEMTEFLEGPRFTDEPVETPPRLTEEPMVVRSLRLPVSVEIRAKAVAAAHGVPVTALMREWIEMAIEQAEGAVSNDPVTELGRRLADVNRAYGRISGHENAA